MYMTTLHSPLQALNQINAPTATKLHTSRDPNQAFVKRMCNNQVVTLEHGILDPFL